jgi:putative flippase GtrA
MPTGLESMIQSGDERFWSGGVSTAVVGKLTRFVFVAAVSAALYALGTSLSIRNWGIDGRWAVVVGYALALPFNFMAHRHHTFRSRGVLTADLLRYVVMQLVNLALCFGAMVIAVNVFALNYVVGIVAGIVVVPVATYLVMDRYVFRLQTVPDYTVVDNAARNAVEGAGVVTER